MKDWKKALATLAPTIATAIGGHWAGAGVGALSKALLGRDNATADEIGDIILAADPQTMAQIKQAENDFRLEMKHLGVELEALAVKDRKSARRMAIDTTLIPQSILSFVFIFGFFGLIWLLLVSGVKIDPGLRDAALMLVGVAGTNVTLAMKFWFGGSPSDGENMKNMYNSIPGERLKK